MGLSASRAASWEPTGAAKASALGKFALGTFYCWSAALPDSVESRASLASRTASKPTTRGRPNKAAPAARPSPSRPADPAMLVVPACGACGAWCGRARAWLARSAGFAKHRRCLRPLSRRLSNRPRTAQAPHLHRTPSHLRDLCIPKAGAGGQGPEIEMAGVAALPSAPRSQPSALRKGVAARSFGWEIHTLLQVRAVYAHRSGCGACLPPRGADEKPTRGWCCVSAALLRGSPQPQLFPRKAETTTSGGRHPKNEIGWGRLTDSVGWRRRLGALPRPLPLEVIEIWACCFTRLASKRFCRKLASACGSAFYAPRRSSIVAAFKKRANPMLKPTGASRAHPPNRLSRAPGAVCAHTRVTHPPVPRATLTVPAEPNL